MTGAADFFPGFQVRTVETSVGRIFARVGGAGPPLLCLHGFPETHAMWHRVSAALARHFTVVAADLPGYGESAIPPREQASRPTPSRPWAGSWPTSWRRSGTRDSASSRTTAARAPPTG